MIKYSLLFILFNIVVCFAALDNTWSCYNYTGFEAPNSLVGSAPRKCFKAFCGLLNKTDAQTQCALQGGTLAEIYTAQDNTVALLAINNANCSGNYWSGAEKKETCKTNCFSYPNGCSYGCSGAGYSNWANTQPDGNGSCAQFRFPDYKMDDKLCSNRINYVCQITVGIIQECDPYQCNCILGVPYCYVKEDTLNGLTIINTILSDVNINSTTFLDATIEDSVLTYVTITESEFDNFTCNNCNWVNLFMWNFTAIDTVYTNFKTDNYTSYNTLFDDCMYYDVEEHNTYYLYSSYYNINLKNFSETDGFKNNFREQNTYQENVTYNHCYGIDSSIRNTKMVNLNVKNWTFNNIDVSNFGVNDDYFVNWTLIDSTVLNLTINSSTIKNFRSESSNFKYDTLDNDYFDPFCFLRSNISYFTLYNFELRGLPCITDINLPPNFFTALSSLLRLGIPLTLSLVQWLLNTLLG